jgi:fumarylacetoacetate (FAA) hydrolase
VKFARIELADGSIVVATVDDDGYRPVADDAPGALLRALLERHASRDRTALTATDVRVRCPIVDPPSIRDFMIFEEHVANARASRGETVPEVWYEAPIFYFTNPASLRGPGDPVVAPRGSQALDFELEVACLVGIEARDLDPDDRATGDVIAGFMLMNDWSARDIQRREMGGGLGPAKGKDFATSLGPWVVSPDELAVASPGRYACPLEVRVNGRRVGGGDLANAHYTWPQVLARASADTRVRPGDVIGSGTVGTGCLLELRGLGHDIEWLRPDDVVELHGGPLGVLANPVGGTR